MPQIGPMEILVVSVLGLIVFGPDKLPEIARTVGAFMRQLRSMADDVKQEFSDGLEVADEPDDEELAAITQEDDAADVGGSDEGPTEEEPAEEGPAQAEPASEESSNGRREPPPDHPVAEAIKSERDVKGSGREA
ncbi:MAG: Sec-independent protein translocase protein TatB [Actinomycetota bacterium]